MVSDSQMVEDMLTIGRLEGISAAPEGAAALSAARDPARAASSSRRRASCSSTRAAR
ncbi:MAG: hypothetical protein R2708_26400 [Vicinamibacterales bacterium]